MAYIAEIEQIADTLGVLIISAVIDIGTSSAAATLCRRRVWLDSCGLKETYLDNWMKHPTPGNGGLMGATPERVAAFKEEQASKEVLQKELAHMLKSKPATASTPAPAGRGASFDAAARHMRNVYLARGGRGKSRGKYRAYNSRPRYTKKESKPKGAKDSNEGKADKPATNKK